MTARKSNVWIVALVSVMLLVACGGPAAAPISVPPADAPIQPTKTLVPPTATPIPPTATSIPSDASVTGTLTGQKSKKPVGGAFILLCAVAEPSAVEPVCVLHANLIATANSDGKFEFPSVAPGSYVVVYSLSDAARGSWDGLSVHYRGVVMGGAGQQLDPFGVDGESQFDAPKLNVSGDGMQINTGYAVSSRYGLTLEYRDSKPPTITVAAGDAGSILLEATTQ